MRRSEVIARFTLGGATLGLLVGLHEAALLFFNPRLAGLLQPLVHSIIWVVAPLVDLLLFGILGLVLGLFGAVTKTPKRTGVAVLVAALLAAAIAYMASDLGLLQDARAALWTPENLRRASLCFLIAFAAIFSAICVWRPRASFFFGDLRSWWHSPLANQLFVGTGILITMLVLHLSIRFAQLPSLHVYADVPQTARQPNIVLITMDTVRADHLSAYGYFRPTSPNFDRLATQGVLFENAIASSSWTLPSHESILTGLLPHQHGADWFTPPSRDLRTLAEILKSSGYETAGFSANLNFGLAGWGMERGFEIYEDDSSSIRYNLAATLAGRAFLQPLYERLIRDDRLDRRNAAQVNRDVVRWLRRRSNRPFFLFINYFEAHQPYRASAPYDRRFGRVSESMARYLKTTLGGLPPQGASEADRAALIAGYDNCIAFVDDQLGKLLEALERQPDAANTTLIVTSDHGEAFGEHGTYDHCWNLYREGIHVPLVIVGPRIPVGRRIPNVVPTRKLFATLLDLASGGKLPLHDFSLRRFWEAGFRSSFLDMALSELVVPHSPSPDCQIAISLITTEWHFLRNARGKEELYHWPSDPEEKIDLSDSPQYVQTVEDLKSILYTSVRRSLRPWHGREYAAALDQPGHPFVREIVPGADTPTHSLRDLPRIGAAQALVSPTRAKRGQALGAQERELIQSIPYQ